MHIRSDVLHEVHCWESLRVGDCVRVVNGRSIGLGGVFEIRRIRHATPKRMDERRVYLDMVNEESGRWHCQLVEGRPYKRFGVLVKPVRVRRVKDAV